MLPQATLYFFAEHSPGFQRIVTHERCAMTQQPSRRRGSLAGPIILIVLGVLFLTWNFRPYFDPWLIIFRYWPVVLILVGLGKVWDYQYARRHPESTDKPLLTGVALAWIIILVLFAAAVWHGASTKPACGGWVGTWRGTWHRGAEGWRGGMHDVQAIETGGATSAAVRLEMPAGMLNLSGGSSRLLDADFQYGGPAHRPQVNYNVTNGRGQLNITQERDSIAFGSHENDWTLRLGSLPMEISLQMGAGQSNMRLNGLNLSRLDIEMGAGELDLDMTGMEKTNLDANIQGGAGQARIRLPKDVGVRVYASGGIGSVNADGLSRDGDAYVNSAYGKSPSTIEMMIHGGVGEIDLIEEQ